MREHADFCAGDDCRHLPVLPLQLSAAHGILSAPHQQNGRLQFVQGLYKQGAPLSCAPQKRLCIPIHDLFPICALAPLIKLPRLGIALCPLPLGRQIVRKLFIQRTPVKAVGCNGVHKLGALQRRIQRRPRPAACAHNADLSAVQVFHQRRGLPPLVVP